MEVVAAIEGTPLKEDHHESILAMYQTAMEHRNIKPSANADDDEDGSLSDPKNRAAFEGIQAKLLQSMDKQVAEIETRLREKEVQLQRIEAEKTDSGVELFKATTEVIKLNDALATVRELLSKTESHRKIVEVDRENVRREVLTVKAEKAKLIAELDATKKRLEESTERISQLTEINAAYNADLKIENRIQKKIKRSLEIAESQRKQTEMEAEIERKKAEKLQRTAKDLEQVLQAQRRETALAQTAMNKMNDEISELETSRMSVAKHWEDAVSAMAKRDQSFQTVHEQLEVYKERHREAETINRALENEKLMADEKCRQRELDCESLQNQVNALKQNIFNMDSKMKDTRSSLVEAQVAESLYKQELDKVSKHHEIAKVELERKVSTLSELKDRLVHLKEEFDVKIINETYQAVARREEQLIQKAAVELRNEKRELDANNIKLRHSNAILKLKANSHGETMHHVIAERDSLKRKCEEINGHYVTLYEEAKHLIYALERKEHDVNYLKSKLQENNGDDRARPFEMSMLKAQKEIREAKAENDRLQTLWLESQKDLLKSKGAVNKLNTDNSYLRTQLGITETVRNNTTDAIAEAKKEAIDHKMEASKLFGELKKLQPIIEELRERNRVLETQLIEANIRFEEANVNATTSSHMLKTEVRRLYEDRRDLRQARMLDERNTSAIERKYIVAKEMVEKVKQEKYELQKANYELRTRAEDLEKRFVEAKLQLKRFADAATRHVGELANRVDNPRPRDRETSSVVKLRRPRITSGMEGNGSLPAWASLRSTPVEMVDPSIEKRHGTPVSNTSASSLERIGSGRRRYSEAVPDIKELHLKIDSLTSEQTFLLNENQVLKRNLEQITKTIDDVERKLTAKDIKVKRLENENRNHVETNKVLSSRIARAEKVAAYIERQFKEAKPNIKIDYTILGEVEPSTQLLAALLSGDSPGLANQPKSLTKGNKKKFVEGGEQDLLKPTAVV